MNIDRVYIACYGRGVHLTRCCVASIRKWYPRIPIALIKDELEGPYDTEQIEKYWEVEIYQARRNRFGRGMSKFEPLTQIQRERCMILDNDIVFLGKVIDRLERFQEDFIVASHPGPPDKFEEYFFVQSLLKQLDGSFSYAGGAFNTGQFVATTGILKHSEVDGFLTESEPRTIKRKDVFKAAEQGLLNYLLLKRQQEGTLHLRYDDFMWWSDWLQEGRVTPDLLDQGSQWPVLLHWAGPKPSSIDRMRHSSILQYFDKSFYSRIPRNKLDQIEEDKHQIAEKHLRNQRRRNAVIRLYQKNRLKKDS